MSCGDVLRVLACFLYLVNTGMVVFVVGMMVISLLGKGFHFCFLSWQDLIPAVWYSGNSFLLTQLYEYVKPLVFVLALLPPFHLVRRAPGYNYTITYI